MIREGDVVVYPKREPDGDPCQEANTRALAERVGLVWRIVPGTHLPIDVKWTSYCSLSHAEHHLQVVGRLELVA